MLLIKSFIISLLYVGFGTLSLVSMSPSGPIYWEWSMIGLLLTFPVTFISFSVMFMEKNYYALLSIQSIVFCVFWLLLYRFLKKNSK